jgi:hypothetical protein
MPDPASAIGKQVADNRVGRFCATRRMRVTTFGHKADTFLSEVEA